MTTAVVIPAAGRGERLGSAEPKALRSLAGKPLLNHAVLRALASHAVSLVVVAAPPDHLGAVRDALSDLSPPPLIVPGGSTRRASVDAGLAALPGEVDVVLVHDAARCLAPPDLFDAVADAVTTSGRRAEGTTDGVIPVLAVADTIKEVAGDRVIATPDRDALRVVQTPQGFPRPLLQRAHAEGIDNVTDDAGLVERAGGTIRIVPGHPEAFKITTPLDLVLAEALLSRRAAADPFEQTQAPS